MYNLISRARDTKYLTHYKNLEGNLKTSNRYSMYVNDKFYEDIWKKIMEANISNTNA